MLITSVYCYSVFVNKACFETGRFVYYLIIARRKRSNSEIVYEINLQIQHALGECTDTSEY